MAPRDAAANASTVKGSETGQTVKRVGAREERC